MIVNNFLTKLKKTTLFTRITAGGTPVQFIRYLISGLLSAGAEFVLLILLTEYAGLWYIASNSIAFASGFWISFLLNRYWSFSSKKHFGRQLVQYSLLFIINLGLSTGFMYLLTTVAGLDYILSKVFVMGLIVLWNFIIYKKIIYRNE